MDTPTPINLENMVIRATWKELLLDMIESEKLDPWNVDIVQISENFFKKVHDMKKIDLIIPANIILAAAILLKYKSNYLRWENEPDTAEMQQDSYIFEPIPELTLSDRLPPKRQITLDELVNEMEQIIKYETTERIVKHRGGIDSILDWKVNEIDIEKQMGETFRLIVSSVDKEGWTMFSRLFKNEKTLPCDIIYMLLSILHLSQKNKIDIKQDVIFEEIFIKPIRGHY